MIQKAQDRRVVAVFFPRFFVELAQKEELLSTQGVAASSQPLAIVIHHQQGEEQQPQEQIRAVSYEAERLGVSVGQRVCDAISCVADLQVLTLLEEDITQSLLELAELLQKYTPLISVELPQAKKKNQDTIWLDITGNNQLFSDVDVVQEIIATFKERGHLCYAAVAQGPRIAGTIARHHCKPNGPHFLAFNDSDCRDLFLQSPITALPLAAKDTVFLAKLGLHNLFQLQELPSSTLSSRIGKQAQDVVQLLRGEDPLQGIPCTFPKEITSSTSWEEPEENSASIFKYLEPLLHQLSERLQGRAEGVTTLSLHLFYDASISRLLGTPLRKIIDFQFTTPVYRQVDLERFIGNRLKSQQLQAPVTALQLTASDLREQGREQLNLEQRGEIRPQGELPLFFNELEVEAGVDSFGTFTCANNHRPEERAKLSFPRVLPSRRKDRSPSTSPCDQATRLYHPALPVSGDLSLGQLLSLNACVYKIVRVQFAERLSSIEWWKDHAISRDYYWIWLELLGHNSGFRGLFYRQPNTGQCFLHGLCD
ncbi:MAG: hypothetical protein MK135_06350 [Polyangiaceae bacterium]|nr:hypothetical protein [Polyangiaceae bacterium]